MNAAAKVAVSTEALVLTKAIANLPALEILGGELLAIRAGTIVALAGKTFSFADGATVNLDCDLKSGDDFVVVISGDGRLGTLPATSGAWAGADVIGGGHFAPGGAAAGRSGGDAAPRFDPHSLWDVAFRPTCPDPRGMVFVAGSRGAPHVAPFWIDKYLLAQDHLTGTSRLGATIADGRNRPQRLDGAGNFDNLNFATAKAVLAHHGKQVPSLDEFFAAVYGVTEKSSSDRRSEVTALDAARTSGFGVIQASGQRYVWGHDGDPDEPRASLFGGDWDNGEFAGSRCAVVGRWPGDSAEWLGARGRSDHLQLG